MISASYGEHSIAIGAAIARARTGDLMRRIRDQDHTVWKPEAEEISNRLGWLRAPGRMKKEVGRIARFAEETGSRTSAVLLLGMGGSSLAPEAFAGIFGAGVAGGTRLRVIDTTDADHIAAIAASTDPLRTLHIVATKSGTTIETLSAFRFFHRRVVEALDARGRDEAGEGDGDAGARFAAITDPGSPLAQVARDLDFSEIFLNPPDVGGRYSALTFFGLVPAALVGADVEALLERAEAVMRASLAGEDGRALGLGVALGVLAEHGRDKLTLSTSPEIEPLADWVEQLVAESTGKEGKGIVPVVREPLGAPGVYGADRVFVDLALADDGERADAFADLERAGHPVIWLGLRDLHDVGGQIALWELATAIAGAQLAVNPFDQPDVEAAKARARATAQAYAETGALPESPAAPLETSALADFLGVPPRGAYVGLQAYVTPSPDADDALRALRLAIRDRYRVATTAGYGPRYLHSTGQLHKGGGGGGIFVQLTSEARADLVIPAPETAPGPAEEPDAPGEETRRPLTFCALKAAQAVGDREALEAAGRRVIRFDVGADAPAGIETLAEGLSRLKDG